MSLSNIDNLTIPPTELFGNIEITEKKGDGCCGKVRGVVFSGEDCTLRGFLPGEAVKTETRSIGLICSGEANIYSRSGNSRALLRKLGRGDVFGAATLFGGDGSFVTDIITKKEVGALFFSYGFCEKLVRSSPEFALCYIGFLSDRIRFLNSRIASYTAPDAEQKLVRFLLEQSKNGKVRLESMSALAKALNIGRASLYRTLDTLRENGVIEKSGKEIIIKNECLLKAMIKKGN